MARLIKNKAWGREPDFDRVGCDERISTKGGRLLKSVSKNRHSNTVRGCVIVMRTNANADVPLGKLVADVRRKEARDRAIRAAEIRKRHAKVKVYKVPNAKKRPVEKPKAQRQLNRDSSVVLELLGDRSCAQPDKVFYKKDRSALKGQVSVCELRVRINGHWFGVSELLTVGFVDEQFLQYAGLISEERASMGRRDLERHFHIVRLGVCSNHKLS